VAISAKHCPAQGSVHQQGLSRGKLGSVNLWFDLLQRHSVTFCKEVTTAVKMWKFALASCDLALLHAGHGLLYCLAQIRVPVTGLRWAGIAHMFLLRICIWLVSSRPAFSIGVEGLIYYANFA
jgi:hypothetical protein